MARRAARHVRRIKRLTPRRWLPFVALSALVVAAVALEENPAQLRRASLEGAPAVAAPSSVAAPGAVSSAWFCGGGTARGAAGPAELTLVIANQADVGATADVTVYDDDGGEATVQVAVPARGRQRVVASDVLQGRWASATVEVRGGRAAVDREVSGPLGFDAGPCSTTASDEWYVPSGSTLRGAEQFLALFNPFPDDASVDIRFATETNTRVPSTLQSYTVPGRSLRMVQVSAFASDRSEVATTVRASAGRLVVDRLQLYDGTGDVVTGEGTDAITTPAPQGLVSTSAIPDPAARWYFPSSRISVGNRSQLAIANPSGRTAEVDVVLTYQDADRFAELEPVGLTIRAGRQQVLDLTDLPGLQPDTNFTIDVRSLDGVPVVAERLTFFGADVDPTGAGVSVGSPVAASKWLVVQGGSTRTRSSSVSVANPGPSDVTVRVLQLTDGRQEEVTGAEVVVPAGDRRGLELDDVAAAATLVVEADGPVVVASGLTVRNAPGVSVAPASPFPETVVPLPSAT